MNWPMVTLGEVSKNVGQYGVGLSSREWGDGDPRYIRITDIRDDGRLNASVVAPDGDHSDWNKAILQPGDLLFARSGATVGKTYLHGADAPLAVYAGYLIRFQLDTDRVLPEYAFRFTQSPEYRAWVASSQRAVAQPNINAKQYATLPIPLPPIDAQRRIAAILDHVDALRGKRGEVLNRLNVLRGSVFSDMFGDPVASSKTRRLVELSEIQIGPFGSLLHKEDYVTGGVPLINPMHIVSGEIRPDPAFSVPAEKAATLDNYRLRAGDVVMGRRGEMGRCAVAGTEHAGYLCGTGSLIVRPRPELADSIYVHAALSHARTKSLLERLALGTTLPNLNATIVSGLPITTPPLVEQKKFRATLERLGVQSQLTKRALKADDDLFTSLQSRAFAGQL